MESKGTTVVASCIHQALTDSHRYTTLTDATDELGCKFPNELSSFLCKLGIGDSNTGNNLCHVMLLEKDMRHIDSVLLLLHLYLSTPHYIEPMLFGPHEQ